MSSINKNKYLSLTEKSFYKKLGKVTKIVGLTIESVGPDAKLNDLCKIIDIQPTAYDVDKVIEQLNNIKKYNLNLADIMLDIQANGTNRHFICLEDAIEIIKAGGNLELSEHSESQGNRTGKQKATVETESKSE